MEELAEEASWFIFRTAGLIIFVHYFRNAIRFDEIIQILESFFSSEGAE